MLIVSEGEHELGAEGEDSALENLVRKMLDWDAEFERRSVRDARVHMHLRPGKHDGYEKRALGWLRLAEREEFCALVLVIDHDTDDARQKQLDKAQDSPAFGVQRALGAAMHSFDAWILADEAALTSVLRRPINRQRDPETIRDPKAVCRKLRDESPDAAELSTARFYAAVAKELDIKMLAARCPKRFKPFASKVRALSCYAVDQPV